MRHGLTNNQKGKTMSKTIDQPASKRSCPAPTGSVFHVEKTGVFRGAKLIVSVWPSRKACEDRMDGESWLDMRRRTAEDRLNIELATKRRAQEICDFLNSQNVKGES